MNVRMLIAPALLAAVLAACGGSATSEPTPEPTAGSAATATPPGERGIATGQVASGKALRSSDGRLVISGTGKAPLDVTVRELAKDLPDEPFGWELSGPVYDIAATEGSAAVKQLTDPFELRFEVTEPLATVMYFDGQEWSIIESELADGVLTAETDHLSQFAVMTLANLRVLTPTRTPTATPTPVEGTVTPTRTPAVSPTPTATPVSPEAMADVLAAEVEKWRKNAALVTGAGAYAGASRMELPAPLQESLEGADLIGDLYYGVFNGVNEVFVVGSMRETVSGGFTLLIEPKLEFPSSSSQAQRMLAEYFPGATGQTFVAVTELPAMYAYQAAGPFGFMILGFIQHEGVPLAYMSVGSGAFVGPATDTKE
jgi:hypothetical protein